jgi:hypothetical protein
MTKRQAIKESIAHWKRMIKWAKTQPVRSKKYIAEMSRYINESPSIWDCSLCTKYISRTCSTYICSNSCPLIKNYRLSCFHDDSLYHKVADTKTWGAWVKRAEKMLRALKDLL